MTDLLLAKVQQLVKERQVHADAITRIDGTLGGIRAALAGETQNDFKPSATRFASGGKTGVRAGKTANGKPVTLADHMEAVIREAGKPVAIGDLIEGVSAAGYKSKSKNLRPTVSIALVKNNRFKRVGRGVYSLR